MSDDVKWYRVVDPLSPLCGCDVRLGLFRLLAQGGVEWGRVEAMRKVDVFVGDRPFQLVAKEGEDLGLMINLDQLAESPFQADVMEIGRDRPHGICLDESEMTRADGVTLRVARYERAVQIALEDPDDCLLATATETSAARSVWETKIIDMFERGDDQDDLCYALRSV
jgi:hypothetical protein